MTERPTCSIIVIGDEILKGQTQDTNSHFLCRELYKCGVCVSCITVISDDVDTIAEEIKLRSHKYTYVLTSGGIGPTHDDVTYEGVAKAFDEKLILNKDLQKILVKLCHKMNLNESAAIKMSFVPQTAEIHSSGNVFIPIVSVRNVFMFPGIPFYLEQSFNKLKHLFEDKKSKPYVNSCLYVNVNEFEITDVLNTTVKEFEKSVKIGSYPDINNSYFQVKLTLEADSLEALTEAEAYLRSHLPQNSVVGQYPPDSEEALKLMMDIIRENGRLRETGFAQTLKQSMDILEKCFQEYSMEQICLSFNGGKDCTALLHLVYIFLAQKYKTNDIKLKVLYFRTNQPFPEIEDFIQHSLNRYNLQMLAYKHPIKEGLFSLKKDHPEIKAVLMGCRLTDPRCSSLQPFQTTDVDWPQFMRVNPLTHWTYVDVWKFMRELQVPYCSLYDRGYTSLGCKHNTLPNEELLTTTKNGKSYYKPAYLLRDLDQERKGRCPTKSN